MEYIKAEHYSALMESCSSSCFPEEVIGMVDLSKETISRLFFQQIKELSVKGVIGGE